MKTEITKWESKKILFVKWIIVNILFRISPLGVLAFCLETANLYHENIEIGEKDDLQPR